MPPADYEPQAGLLVLRVDRGPANEDSDNNSLAKEVMASGKSHYLRLAGSR